MSRIHLPPTSSNEYHGIFAQSCTYLQDISNMDQECGVMITLDGACFAISRHMLSLGTYTSDYTDLKILFNRIIKDKALKFVFAHNHPNGVAVFSEGDIKFTISVLWMCSVLQIELIDHVLFPYKRPPVSMRQTMPTIFEKDWLKYFSDYTDRFVPRKVKK